MLTRYDWPGNVRELRNLVERTVVLADSQEVHADALLDMFPTLRNLSPSRNAPSSPPPQNLWDMEKAALERALEECGGNLSQAARKLGIARHHMRYRIRKFNIDTPPRSTTP